MTTSIQLETSLTLDACRDRLRRAEADADNDDWDADTDRVRMLVSVDGDRFTVMNGSDDLGPRTLRTRLYAAISSEHDRVEIRGQFRLHPMARVALIVWFASLALVTILVAIINRSAVSVAVPIVMMGVALQVVRSGVAQSRRGEPAVVEFVERLLDARASGSGRAAG